MSIAPSVLASCLLLVTSSHVLLAQQLLEPVLPGAPDALAQQAPAAALDPAAGPWRSEWISVDRASFGFVQSDRSLVAEGAGYHVTFDRGSFRFLPALGRTAPADRPVTFAVETIGRGDAVLYRSNGDVPQQPSLHADGMMASWNRGGIVERFEARADGVEHSFVFAERPAGTGDLVVRLRLDTDLLADAGRDLQQLELVEPGIARITIGAVTGIDAFGMRSPGSMHFDGRHLELVLPARFVDSAAYPMVLDPLIGTPLPMGNPADNDRLPDCAYDSGTDRYLVVWERFFSSTNVVVRGQLLTGSGAFSGPALAITDQGGLLETNPTVANINFNDCFVVGWAEGASSAGPRDIACRLVRADQGTFGPILVVASGPDDQVDPDIGGDSTTSNNNVLIVFRDATAGIIEVRDVGFDRASGQGTLGAQLLVAGPTPGIGRPAISKSGGASRKYLVAWDNGGPDIGARIVNQHATAWSGVGLIGGVEPEKVDVDGDGSRWTLVWNQLEPGQPSGGNRDVWATTITATAAPTTAPPAGSGYRAIAANPGDDEAEPAVAFYGDATTSTSTVAWYDATTRPASVLSGTNIQRDNNTRSGNPWSIGAVTGGFQVRWPHFATKLSGGLTSYDGLLAFWSNNVTTFDGDVYVQLHRVHQGGPFSSVSGGCAGGGQVGLDFGLALGRRTNISLRQADPSAVFGFLLVGDPSLSRFTCGQCTTMSNSLTVAVGVSFGTAGFALFVPGNPVYTGAVLDLQFAVFGSQIQSCPLVPGAAVSDIVRATIRD